MFLIRFDQNSVEWIAQLPGTHYNAGAFTPLGEYWITGSSRKMMRFEHLHQLTGYATAAEATAGRDWSGHEYASRPSTPLGNDFVVVEGSFDGCTDDPPGWSAAGENCADYQTENYCTSTGAYGTGWRASYGLFSDWQDASGKDASQACCACGGGTSVHQYSISAEDGFVILHKLDAIGTSWLLTPNAAFDGAWGSAWMYAGRHRTGLLQRTATI
jgi:hypothetical protein